MRKDADLAGLHLTHVIAKVKQDPEWADASLDEQLAEVVRRLGDDAAQAFIDARAALVSDMEARLLTVIDDPDRELPDP